MPAVATKLSMIVEITSLTPRRTLRYPAKPAQAAPTSIAARRTTPTCSTRGRWIVPPSAAATSAASRYWPSTPMLNRFMRKPIATATAAK